MPDVNKEIKDFRTVCKNAFKNLNPSAKELEQAKELLEKYREIKSDINKEKVTIKDLDQSLNNIKSLVENAYTKSRDEWDDIAKKNHNSLFTWIKDSGKKLADKTGFSGIYSSLGNIEKAFNDLKENMDNLLIWLTPKNCTSYQNVSKHLTEEIEKMQNNFQKFFKDYATRKMTDNGWTGVKINFENLPITSAYIIILSSLAGISNSEKSKTEYFGGGYTGLLMQKFYDGLDKTAKIRCSSKP